MQVISGRYTEMINEHTNDNVDRLHGCSNAGIHEHVEYRER